MNSRFRGIESLRPHRRHILQLFGAAGASAFTLPIAARFNDAQSPLPVAAAVTVYRRNSHADVLLGKILEGWRQDGGAGPRLKLVSLYTDQQPDGDLAPALSQRHGFRIVDSIHDALTLGTDSLQVAGILNIGEHGDYPTNPFGQKLYPRRRFFDEAVAAMKNCRQFIPIFNDKHLSWSLADALHMVRTAQQYSIPFMAGSSLPVAWRYPAEQLPPASEITEAVVVGYGGIESYGFHALEALQCICERRKDGESGITSVKAISGEEIWKAEQRGEWNRELVESALSGSNSSTKDLEHRLNTKNSIIVLIQYRDGLKATCAILNGVTTQVGVACKLRNTDAPFRSWFRLEEDKPYGHFAHLLRGIEQMIVSGKAPYPVQRTLLTTGVLAHAMRSLHDGHRLRRTPNLNINYSPAEWPFANQYEENFPAQ